MPVREESSIVPESTFSSSPFTAPRVVKRSLRTYGRPRPTDADGDGLDRFMLNPSIRLGTPGSIYQTGPQYEDEEIPPSSDPVALQSDTDQSIDAHNESAESHALSKDRYAWQIKLREIDEQEDFGDISQEKISEMSVQLGGVALPHYQEEDSEGSSSLILGDNEGTLTEDASHFPLNSGTALDAPRGSLSHKPSPQTPSPRSVPHRRFKHLTPDSAFQQKSKSGESIPTSPSSQANITTPKLCSSPTPPTSDDDMPVDSKGKARARDFNQDSSTRRLSEEVNSAHTTRELRTSSRNARSKGQKIKPPTKKELAETARNRVRIAADQAISLPRTHKERQNKYTMYKLFTNIHGQVESDDPIVDFSSDNSTVAQGCNVAPPRPTHDMPPKSALEVSFSVNRSMPDSDKDSEDLELPEVNTPLVQGKEKFDLEKRYKKLLETKQQFSAASIPSRGNEVEDDDLEIVPSSSMGASMKEEDLEQKSGRKKQISEGRKRQLMLGGITSAKPKLQLLAAGASHLQGYGVGYPHKGKLNGTSLTQSELIKIMATEAETQRQEVIRHKEDEWKRRGGKVSGHDEGFMASKQEVAKMFVRKGLDLPHRIITTDDTDLDESDEDWVSKEGAEAGELLTSSQTVATDEGSHENEDHEFEEGDITMVNEGNPSSSAAEDEDTEGAYAAGLPMKHRSTRKRIVESDSETEEDKKAATVIRAHLTDFLDGANGPFTSPFLPALSHRDSASSMGGPTEDSDEGDKENKKSRMWDRGEDKENTAVVQHKVLSSNSSSLNSGQRLNDQLFSPSLSPRPIALPTASDVGGSRSPFKDLLDRDPLTSPPILQLPTSFEFRLRQSPPKTSSPSASPHTLVSPLQTKTHEMSHLSSGDLERNHASKPSQPSFLDLFDLSAGKQGAPQSERLWHNSFKSPVGTSKRAGLADALELTQDIALQPAFQLSGSMLRKANTIFEKEQELVLEASEKNITVEPELYIDDHGFLTQTKPNISSPEVYKPHPSAQNFIASNPPSEAQPYERHPLRTLPLPDDLNLEPPQRQKLIRLHKRESALASPSPRSSEKNNFSPCRPSQKQLVNAFDVMRQASIAIDNRPRHRLEKSDFIEQEAEESDDEEMLGFGTRNHDRKDEEDGEDLDQALATLVDDQAMDEKTVAPELVREKYKEHEQADDQANEKVHRAVIQGELRKRRRNRGVGMDDSDEDSDEDEVNYKLRRSLSKKQKIDRDNIKALGKHAETKPFFETYENDLLVDASDFGHLHSSQSQEMSMVAREEEDGGSAGQVREVITTGEAVRQMSEVAQQPQTEDDFHDVSWFDRDLSNDEADPPVKPAILKTQKHIVGRRRRTDQTDFEIDPEMPPPQVAILEGNLNRMQSWANMEGRSRGGLGRNAKPATVTRMAKSQGTSRPALASNAPAKQQRALKPQPSVLASVAEERRTTRFG